jgi:hypothetical protein
MLEFAFRSERKLHFRIFTKIFAKIRKFSRKYEHYRENAKIFAKISLRKLTLKAETLLIWNTWGIGYQIEYCLLE